MNKTAEIVAMNEVSFSLFRLDELQVTFSSVQTFLSL